LQHADDEAGRPDPIASDMCRDGSIAVKYFWELKGYVNAQ
jgi:hypothetical protein